jgi:hypothetical protein
MDELSLVEELDAGLRHAEGGGCIPKEMHELDNMNLGDFNGLGNPDVTPWWKNKTYWIVIAAVLVAAGLTFYFAQKKKSSEDSDVIDWE